MSNSPSKGTALITGASRGIGAVYADRLAKRGFDLILVARSEAPLKALSARLRSETGRSVTMGDMIALNITALTHLVYAAAPAFVARGAGTIINIASVVGISLETLNGVYGATKAYVIALSHSLQHELAEKGIRIQAVLPAATATEIWESAGLPWQNLPRGIVMSADDMVDAALAGLDQGELVTLPSLQDGSEWTRFEAAL
jgi:short-subunit dehydrogenase